MSCFETITKLFKKATENYFFDQFEISNENKLLNYCVIDLLISFVKSTENLMFS